MFTPFAFIQPITTVTPITPNLNYLLIGGDFQVYNAPYLGFFAQLNSTGDVILNSSSFNPGVGCNSNIYDIKQQPDGKYVLAGAFSTYSGSVTNATRMVRINQNGTRDTTFNNGSGFNGDVYALLPLSDNSIIAVGAFSTYSGSSAAGIVKISPSGSRDTSFVIGTGLAGGAGGYDITQQSDGKIIVTGAFTTYSGSSSTRIVRINTNGTLDATYITGAGLNGTGNTLTIQPDDKVIVGGAFTTYSGSSSARIVRINTDGTRDTTFNVGAGFNSDPHSLGYQSDGKILAVGNFTTYSGSSYNRIIRINSNGTRDTTFNVGTGLDTLLNTVRRSKILATSNNQVYVTACLTTTYSSSFTGNIMRINSSGTLDTTFVTTTTGYFDIPVGGFTGLANAGGNTLILSGSNILVGGNFYTYKQVVTNRGIMIDSAGALSSSFNIGSDNFAGFGFNNTVQTWVTQSDGKILAGGNFTLYNNQSYIRIVRVDSIGATDPTFNVGKGFSSTVYNLNVQSDDKIIAVGAFTTYDSTSSIGIARLNTNGTIDSTFNVGTGLATNTQGNHSVIQSDGKIIVVGNFTTYSGSSSTRIVRINTDGTRDTTFNTGAGLNSTVEAVLLQPDGKIVVTGNFTSYSGSAVNRITRINSNGTRDTTFNVGTGLTSTGCALAYQSDGKIICASQNSATYSGSTARYLIRINTSGTLDNTFGFYPPSGLSTTTFTPNSLKIDTSGSIYWGNSFTTYSGSFIPNRIVRLNSSGAVDDTFNQAYSNIGDVSGKGVTSANSTVRAVLLL